MKLMRVAQIALDNLCNENLGFIFLTSLSMKYFLSRESLLSMKG